MEAFVFVVLVYKVTHPLRTRAGDAQLADLKTLFDGLKDRSSSFVPGSQTQDFALLTAAFGMSAVPSTFDTLKRLFPKASQSSGCGGSSACGSSWLVVRRRRMRRRVRWLWKLDIRIGSASPGIRRSPRVCSPIATVSISSR